MVYKINGAEYIKVYIKHKGELNPGVVPVYWAVLILDQDYFGLFVVSCRRSSNEKDHKTQNHNTTHYAVITWADILIHLIDRNNTIRTGLPKCMGCWGLYMSVFHQLGVFCCACHFEWLFELLLLG